MSQQKGGRQHIIPACHIASFSNNEEIHPRRKRPVWYRRDGMIKAAQPSAKDVGFREHFYTLKDDDLDKRYVDKTWDFVEHNLPGAVTALENHKTSPLFDGTLWVSILVPFVAQLFCRGEDYKNLLLGRAPSLNTFVEEVGGNLEDTINLNRLIDFQIYCGLLCNAEWRLIHNQSPIPFVLNDLGYATIQSQRYGYGEREGYFIPMSKTTALVITQKNPIREPFNPYGNKVPLVQSVLKNSSRVKFFNQQVVKCAYSEAYGPSEEVLNQAWGDREVRRKKLPVGPVLIQSRLIDGVKLGFHWKWMDKLNIPSTVRKELYGGRVIEVCNGLPEDKEKLVSLVYNEKKKDSLYALVYREL
ncbi:DUF4238 domain-containing protein [Paenibacillus sp. YYML68]|uniref:DUF4238 domain-containing protein n=1 Tax=Paenibacillus sp. YYML68 TaxID=2909250 RepID=UPI0024933017|nr:DUF4238 domain-containing protein [Paenibacillus sp. YYML68]